MVHTLTHGTALAACFAPPLPYFVHSSDETLLLIADSGNKVRLHSPDSNTTLCVVAAPECGGSITSMRVFRPRALGAPLSASPSYCLATGQPAPQPPAAVAAAAAAAAAAVGGGEGEGGADGGKGDAASCSLLAFSVSHKAAGIMALPLDGHPGRASALVAHPGKVAGLTVSADGNSLITAGGAVLAPAVYVGEAGCISQPACLQHGCPWLLLLQTLS